MEFELTGRLAWGLITTSLIIAMVVMYIIRVYFYREYKKRKGPQANEIKPDKAWPRPDRNWSIPGDEKKIVKLNRTIELPETYNAEEMKFIDTWYMEEGILQLRQSHGKQCEVLPDKPPVPGCKYANVKNIMVNFKIRDNKTLGLKDIKQPRTVKLLFLNEWIK